MLRVHPHTLRLAKPPTPIASKGIEVAFIVEHFVRLCHCPCHLNRYPWLL